MEPVQFIASTLRVCDERELEAGRVENGVHGVVYSTALGYVSSLSLSKFLAAEILRGGNHLTLLQFQGRVDIDLNLQAFHALPMTIAQLLPNKGARDVNDSKILQRA